MRILIVHNEYRQAGGEDAVVDAEAALLGGNGHTVDRLTVSNTDIRGVLKWMSTAWQAAYNAGSRKLLDKKIAAFNPDIVHIHNFFPVLSPAIYDACIDAGVPVVQTLHNYRLLCPKATMYRDGRVCEICMTRSPYNAVRFGCYRGSRLLSLMPAHMVSANRRRGTWARKVDRFIALTAFARNKFVEGGLPADRIEVKPNFVPTPPERRNGAGKHLAGALFVGRLSQEKGLASLIEAWRDLDVPIRVLGDGPMSVDIENCANPAIEYLGAKPKDAVTAEMRRASFLVVPSLWYEGFPMVLVEAFSAGLPAIVSRLGSLAEIIEDGVTGLHVEPNDPADLTAKVRWAHDHQAEMRRMGENAKETYLRKYTPEVNYPKLIAVYNEAIKSSRAREMELQ